LLFLRNGFAFRGERPRLARNHKHSYDRIGRWLLAVIILGWAIGYRTEIHQAAIALLFSFLAGGVVLNVLKEELPESAEANSGALPLVQPFMQRYCS
jgi:hypothetical protein